MKKIPLEIEDVFMVALAAVVVVGVLSFAYIAGGYAISTVDCQWHPNSERCTTLAQRGELADSALVRP